MSQVGSKLRHEEDAESTSRYTLSYPELPPELALLIEGKENEIEIPDYSTTSIDSLSDDNDNIKNESNDTSIFVKTYANQGGYDASLDWAPERTLLWHDSLFTQNALLRRALIGGTKGALFGLGLGILTSLWAKRFMSFTQHIPISFHVYTLGGGAFLFGGMNAVHQTKRYREYIGFKQSGVASPHEIGLKDAKNQMTDYLASAYSPQYVQKWKESNESANVLASNMSGIRT